MTRVVRQWQVRYSHCAEMARDEVSSRYPTESQRAARALGRRGGLASSPAQRAQRARVMGQGRPLAFRSSYRSSAKLRASKSYQIAMAEAESLRADKSAGQPDARRAQVIDTIDGLVGRQVGGGRMAWPREIVLAAHLA